MPFDRLAHLLTDIRTVRHRHGVGLRTQWREYRRFREAIRATPREFFGYWLWDVGTPVDERMRYITNAERRAIEYLINPREPSMQVRNKGWATTVLQDADIPVGEVLGLLALDATVAIDSERFAVLRTEADVRGLLASAPADGIVIKPDDGGGGRSVHVFRHAGPEGLVALDHTRWSVDRFLAVLATERLWKIERRLRQHPVLEQIAGETLGTLRVVTFRMLDGTIHLATPVWKIPINLSGVDHYSHGVMQLAARVDPDTGALGPARRWTDLELHDVHPVTGERITGQVMPHWSEAREISRRIAACFPDLGSLAYDIAITAGGPVVIEVNPCWGERPTQAAPVHGMVRGEFLAFLEERGLGSVMNLRARGDAT